MKKIEIKYNPYKVKTSILINGKNPKNDSALNTIINLRLQEWIEKLPQVLIKEENDSNFDVSFIGTQTDYDDVIAAFENSPTEVNANFSFIPKKDVAEVEKEIDLIFSDIQSGPIEDLKNKTIIDAFKKAKDSQFEINVVATMSSGKSTLINALLGKQLMPAANEATTATIVRILASERDDFSAIAYDKSGNIVEKIENVSLKDMKQLNDNETVTSIDIEGRIPFVKTAGMRLVLVDTPGPNNSRDDRHRDMTHKMIADSDKSLVLYVMNGQQLGINDEKNFLDYICDNMKRGGKQTRERYIFAVNKMDAFKPKDEGLDCITKALDGVKSSLEERGIVNPNIFPVSAVVALEQRTEDDEPMALDIFKRGIKKYDALHFEEYYNYNHLPHNAKRFIDSLKEKFEGKEDYQAIIHSGIVSIEQAISQYINKYARTTKVSDLVLAFDGKLKELETFAKFEDALRKDKKKKEELENMISQIQHNIATARKAQKTSNIIDGIDVVKDVEKEISSYLSIARNKINAMMSGRSNKVKKDVAVRQCEQIERDSKNLASQIKVQVDKILKDAYKKTITDVLSEYKKYLSQLNLDTSSSALSFSPMNLVSASLGNISSIVSRNTEVVDESYYETRTKEVFVEGTRKWYKPWTWFDDGDHYETRSYKEKIEKYSDYVDMNGFAEDYLLPLQRYINETQKNVNNHVQQQTIVLKEHLKSELKNIDKILDEKLNALKNTEANVATKAEEIKKKEDDLKWLQAILMRVQAIVEF